MDANATWGPYLCAPNPLMCQSKKRVATAPSLLSDGGFSRWYDVPPLAQHREDEWPAQRR